MEIEPTEQLLAQIDGYLKEELSTSEKEAFEKRLRDEPQLQEEVRLQQQLFNILGKEQWHTIEKLEYTDRIAAIKSKLRSTEYQSLSASIRNAESAYIAEATRVPAFKKYYRYMAVAAAVIFFFSIYVTQTDASLRSYYKEYVNWSELPSFVEKGAEKDTFALGEEAFQQKNYAKAASFFKKIPPTYELYTNSLVYLGASYDQLDQNEKAIATFQKLATVADPQESAEGNWYTAMLYLKLENKDKAIIYLNQIIQNTESNTYDKAKRLLEELE